MIDLENLDRFQTLMIILTLRFHVVAVMKGEVGERGPAGPKGDKGDRGDQGIQVGGLLTLMLLVDNFTNTKSCKNPEK